MALLQRRDEIAYLSLSLGRQQVKTVHEVLVLHRDPPSVHQRLGTPFSITFRNKQ
jgi:hypothetical protein